MRLGAGGDDESVPVIYHWIWVVGSNLSQSCLASSIRTCGVTWDKLNNGAVSEVCVAITGAYLRVKRLHTSAMASCAVIFATSAAGSATSTMS